MIRHNIYFRFHCLIRRRHCRFRLMPLLMSSFIFDDIFDY
jgi:hypothetical protein